MSSSSEKKTHVPPPPSDEKNGSKEETSTTKPESSSFEGISEFFEKLAADPTFKLIGEEIRKASQNGKDFIHTMKQTVESPEFRTMWTLVSDFVAQVPDILQQLLGRMVAHVDGEKED